MEKKIASAKLDSARISLIHSMAILKAIRGKRLEAGKKFLEELLDQKRSLHGKYYPTAAKKILEMLEAVEANAKVKDLTVEKLFIKTAKADKGFRFMRPRTRWRLRGRKVKSATVLIEVAER